MGVRLTTFAVMLLGSWMIGPNSSADAQDRHFGAYLGVGTGSSVSSGQASTVSRRTPLFLDAGMRTWTEERPRLTYGGGLRVEVEGRVAVGVVPHLAYSRLVGPIEIRPFVALPVFFYPFTMLGPEVGLSATYDFVDGVGVFASFLVDVFIWGDDVPRGQVVAMFNGLFGLEMEF